jgi:2-polyprenyl-3-methyl-5-hydroxy-6-metoxy-1,4-benzoquinol methylase
MFIQRFARLSSKKISEKKPCVRAAMGVSYWQMNKSHLTAIKRNKFSAPMQYLRGVFSTTGGQSTGRYLDYGCGRGYDADALQLTKFDTHYFPQTPEGEFDIITCIYVLNTNPFEEEEEIVDKIWNLLAPDGVAYIAVRRDVKKEGLTSRGTFQRNVILNFPIEFEKKNQFCIYKLTK